MAARPLDERMKGRAKLTRWYWVSNPSWPPLVRQSAFNRSRFTVFRLVVNVLRSRLRSSVDYSSDVEWMNIREGQYCFSRTVPIRQSALPAWLCRISAQRRSPPVTFTSGQTTAARHMTAHLSFRSPICQLEGSVPWIKKSKILVVRATLSCVFSPPPERRCNLPPPFHSVVRRMSLAAMYCARTVRHSSAVVADFVGRRRCWVRSRADHIATTYRWTVCIQSVRLNCTIPKWFCCRN